MPSALSAALRGAGPDSPGPDPYVAPPPALGDDHANLLSWLSACRSQTAALALFYSADVAVLPKSLFTDLDAAYQCYKNVGACCRARSSTVHPYSALDRDAVLDLARSLAVLDRPGSCPSSPLAPPAPDDAKGGADTDLDEWRQDASRWLYEVCQRLQQVDGDGCIVLSAESLFREIISIVSSMRTDEDIQPRLFDLLGTAGFDDIVGIIARRAALRDAVAQMRVTSDDAKRAHRKNRPQNRRQTRPQPSHQGEGRGRDADFISVLRDADFGAGSQKRTLVADAVREHFEGWEQVTIPARVGPPRAQYDADLKSITEIDVWARPAFTGVTRFNRMQSRCLTPAYCTNENLLVCAPTGAGKTNVALLCIIREVKQHVSTVLRDGHVPIGALTADLFKIVYIAPMKALAQEIVAKFGRALRFLGVRVRELTGDMQLSKREIDETHIIVTTPEKWDVITRKSNDLIGLVRLLIIDEVHILHDSRGSVIEVLVARTIRQVESSQSMIRIVGLSATLPNYADVAAFLRVSPQKGLLAFDETYRPVPLQQTFIGVTHPNSVRRLALLNEICHRKLIESLRGAHQVMVFVHSRRDTVETAQAMIDLSRQDDTISVLNATVTSATAADSKLASSLSAQLARCSSRDLRALSAYGIGIHHAGMFRDDRALSESAFAAGFLRVLVTTATLAWGVNLPAHTVVIKGTQVYSAQHGGYVDLSMLDVMQIFGRAGRPQYDTSGHGILITQGESLPKYLRWFVRAMPIESRLTDTIVDNLNAEINLGTVSNVAEALRWMSYTYLFVRMRRNPQHYGVDYQELISDPTLVARRGLLVDTAVRRLVQCRMLVVPAGTEVFMPTDLGRTASFFYISAASVEIYLRMLSAQTCTDDVVLRTVAASTEFLQIKVRNEELGDLDELRHGSCPVLIERVDTPQDKVNVLLQAHISRHRPSLSSLVSDTNYVIQSAGRICRALYEICLKRGWSHLCLRFFAFCKMVERRMWDWETPLRQFPSGVARGIVIPDDLAYQIEQRRLSFSSILSMKDRVDDLSALLPSVRYGPLVLRAARFIPRLAMHWQIQPINATVCKISIRFAPDFVWSDRVHGSVQVFRFLAFEADAYDRVHHAEEIALRYEDYAGDQLTLEFYIGVGWQDALPQDVFVSIDSDVWLGSEVATQIHFDGVVLPPENVGHTPLLDLHPLPVTALRNVRYQRLYGFDQFNTVQTQCFHLMYQHDLNVLLGAPTGSGKTIVAELAILKMLRDAPQKRAVYIAPLKALVRERLISWRLSLGLVLGLNVVEITGEAGASMRDLRRAHVLVTTPEKFDSLSRRWRDRSYIRDVGLVIIDELHLLGGVRGPVLEVIVSRLHFMSSVTGDRVRLVGLSTSLANADDVADWMQIAPRELYNFHPSVRPTPLSVHIAGFPGSRHYCPRMQMLNKPAYASIMAYAQNQPALVFVSSRRQTRLTALGLISLTVADGDPHKFLHMEHDALAAALDTVSDDCLRHVLEFGIGLHHAGLCDSDRRLVESMFSGGQIHVLVCTSTLAWGVNLPAHLVVIKGTEYFDAARRRYVDYPVTDVIQMAGRAGRPQFRDTEAHAVVLVHESKKRFYKKFLFEPFPVESSLLDHLHDHVNAEIQTGQIGNLADAIDYVSWTFLFRRLCKNPTYYGLQDGSVAEIRTFLLARLRSVLRDLHDAGCVQLRGIDDGGADLVSGTGDGRLASDFYLRYRTVALMRSRLLPHLTIQQVMLLVCECEEFAQVPVRHNEDGVIEAWAKTLPWPSPALASTSPHLKAFILLQALIHGAPVPVTDFITDTKSVIDQAARVIQALLSLSASMRLGRTTLVIVRLMQCLGERRPEDTTFISAHLLRYPVLRLSYTIRNKVDLDVHLSEEFAAADSDCEHQWWLAIIVPDRDELRSWRRAPSQLPASVTFASVMLGDAVDLHLLSENFVGLDQVVQIRDKI